MKKTIIATLLILLIASASVFAAVSDNFTVTTTVAERGDMKVTTAAMVGHTAAAYGALADFTNLAITASGAQGTAGVVAYMTTLSNKRTGYKVTMAATPMINGSGATASYIDYTVVCGTQTAATHGAAATTITGTAVDTVSGLTGLTGKSMPISLTVDGTTFDAAVAGLHTGTVTFTFTAL
ncbi:hypothetical protein [Sphaerochaeta sp. PS]|uniref:hypothetical protein n=1 Tax=Sphaerochaeta sp. PS TaxID=3076336 RepID=UPI0028A32EBD|nr:hypothetical protein [Sphaerochaeta sp. PS]MDT4763277.1 hypothetical protein [Sphaerochaeta sp. PS]